MNWAKKWHIFENYCAQIGHDPTPPQGEVTEALWRVFMHFNQEVSLEAIPRLRQPEDVLYCVVGSSAGRYVPQRFAEKFALPDEDREVLLGGPCTDWNQPTEEINEHYWDVWDDVLMGFTVEDEDFETDVFFAERSGDVFAVRDDISEVEAFLYLEG